MVVLLFIGCRYLYLAGFQFEGGIVYYPVIRQCLHSVMVRCYLGF